jgi:hypothetical protein
MLDYKVDSKCNSIESTTFEMYFNLRLEDGCQLSLKDFYHLSVATGDRFKLSHRLFCEGLVIQVKLQRLSSVASIIRERRVCVYVCPYHLTELH